MELMTELGQFPNRLRSLLNPHRPGWKSLAGRSSMLFLAGGGLLFVTTALVAVELVTPLSTQGPLTGVTSFTGLILSYVGLLGLYPWFAGRTPRAARAGFALVAFPTLMLAMILVWGLASHLPIGAVPSPVGVVPGFGMVFVMTFLLFAVGMGVFGVASLRTGVPSRVTGLLLLVLAATWGVLLGASGVYGVKFPTWLDALTFGVRAIVLLGIGYSLKGEASLGDYTEHITDQIE